MFYAQYKGPSAAQLSTVSDVLANAKHNTHVHLKGKITHKIEGEEYMFSDGTGKIRVEIGNHIFTMAVDESTVVIIYGEYEKFPMFSPEIDVDAMTIQAKA